MIVNISWTYCGKASC